jgi:hypothetical protein
MHRYLSIPRQGSSPAWAETLLSAAPGAPPNALSHFEGYGGLGRLITTSPADVVGNRRAGAAVGLLGYVLPLKRSSAS